MDTKFIERIAEILEIDVSSITPNMDFRNAGHDWDSMKGFAMIAMIEDSRGSTIDLGEFLNLITVADLWAASTKSP